MEKRNQGSDMENREVQFELQKREIKETLQHIKNKFLVMSGKGDVGDLSLLDNTELPISKEFEKMVDEILQWMESETPIMGQGDARAIKIS